MCGWFGIDLIFLRINLNRCLKWNFEITFEINAVSWSLNVIRRLESECKCICAFILCCYPEMNCLSKICQFLLVSYSYLEILLMNVMSTALVIDLSLVFTTDLWSWNICSAFGKFHLNIELFIVNHTTVRWHVKLCDWRLSPWLSFCIKASGLLPGVILGRKPTFRD